MSNSASSSGGGVGFAGLLTVLFVGLKLGHVIAWSWWWVLAPLWLPVAALGGVALLAGAVFCVVRAVKAWI